MSNGIAEDRIIIEGVREDNNKPFRPSDWAERISEMLASFGPDHKLHYSEFVHPCIIGGEQCLVVNRKLNETQPDAFKFILKFAQENQLRIQEDRRVVKSEVRVERRAEQQDLVSIAEAVKNPLPA